MVTSTYAILSKKPSQRNHYSNSSRKITPSPPTYVQTSPSALTRPSSTSILSHCSSWEVVPSSKESNTAPSEHSAKWETHSEHALASPIDEATAVDETLRWPHIRHSITQAAEAASDSIQDRLNRAFQGKDLPAMHDNALKYIPTMSMPIVRHLIRSLDVQTDALTGTHCPSAVSFVDEEQPGDHLAFARRMGVKARCALVNQGICKEWQVLPTRETVQWGSQMDAALIQFFDVEKKSFGIEQLFSMEPVWTADVVAKVWRLELDTGLTEIVVDIDTDVKGDGVHEKKEILKVDFALPERCSYVRIADVGRDVVSMGEWMAVEV